MDKDLQSIAAARAAADRAWEAFTQFRQFDPDRIDEMVQAMARAIEPEARHLAELAVDETGYGNVEDKRIKNLFNSVSVADWLKEVNTLGLLWQDEVTKVAAIGEPMGVVAALIPVTNPTSTIIYKVLSAIKSGNAIVLAPHPKGVRCGMETCRIMDQAAREMGAPKGLIQCLDAVTIQGTAALMSHRRTSVVLATGGPGMVKAAYSSGKPTLAVGAGNVPCYVHESRSRDLAEVAEQIVVSKCFDYGTACVSEQAVVVDRAISREFEAEVRLKGGYFCTSAEAASLARVIFNDKNQMNPERVGQSPQRLAELAGFDLPPNVRVLVVRENEVGWQIVVSKCFDYGTASVSEQAVVVDRAISREFEAEVRLKGGYFCTSAEAASLARVIFNDKNQMNPERVGQSPQRLAELAGFDLPPNVRVLVVRENEVGWQAPLSAEKLNPVLAWYESKSADEGIEIAERIARFGGWGHSAVLHADDPEIAARYARLPVSRVLVNTPAIHGGMGFSTDLEPSFMLGTGTSSGSIVSDNVTALHLINIKRVAYESRPWRDIYEVYGE